MSASINSGFAPNWNWARPMRNAPPFFTRPPASPLASIPRVVSATGLGLGGGAGIGINSDANWGNILVFIGLNPAANGEINLNFPATAPNLTCAAAWADITLVLNGTPNPIVRWGVAGKPRLVPNTQPLIISYELTVSR